jgi:hypothetical protein
MDGIKQVGKLKNPKEETASHHQKPQRLLQVFGTERKLCQWKVAIDWLNQYFNGSKYTKQW